MFTVMLFFNLMSSFAGPAGTRWAALLYGPKLLVNTFPT